MSNAASGAGSHLVLGRPAIDYQEEFDIACRTARQNADAYDLRILYMNVSYNLAACAHSLKALPTTLPDPAPDAACPVPGAPAQCPCALSSTAARCDSLPCFLCVRECARRGC